MRKFKVFASLIPIADIGSERLDIWHSDRQKVF